VSAHSIVFIARLQGRVQVVGYPFHPALPVNAVRQAKVRVISLARANPVASKGTHAAIPRQAFAARRFRHVAIRRQSSAVPSCKNLAAVRGMISAVSRENYVAIRETSAQMFRPIL
jgi:hypothetical protein